MFSKYKCIGRLLFNKHLMNMCRRYGPIIPTGFVLCSQAVKLESHPDSISEKLTGVDPSSLSHSFLLKNASSCTVDYAIVLLNRTVSAMLDIEEKYATSMNVLISLLAQCTEMQDEAREDVIWQAIISTRAKVNQYKATRMELSILMSTVERLLLASAEAAYLTGAEHSSFTVNQMLSDSQTRLTMTQRSTEDIEKRLTEAEVRMIEHSAAQQSKADENLDTNSSAENVDGEGDESKINDTKIS